jgi:hypothetical protein
VREISQIFPSYPFPGGIPEYLFFIDLGQRF